MKGMINVDIRFIWRAFVSGVVMAFVGVLSPAKTAVQGGPPVTARRPVTDSFHGVDVTEDYRWLEDSGSADVIAWGEAQTEYARGILDNLPGVDAIRGRVTEILGAETVQYYDVAYREGRFFAMSTLR